MATSSKATGVLDLRLETFADVELIQNNQQTSAKLESVCARSVIGLFEILGSETLSFFEMCNKTFQPLRTTSQPRESQNVLREVEQR